MGFSKQEYWSEQPCPSPGNLPNPETESVSLISPAGISCRITEAEEQIAKLEDRIVEITAEEQNKQKRMTNIEYSLRDFWDNI